MTTTSALTQGFLLGIGLFIDPGPKDIAVLRMALDGRWALGLVAIGALSDALLIAIGMAGVSAALRLSPSLQKAALWIGVCVMLWHGLRAARDALRGDTGAMALQTAEKPAGHGWTVLLAASLLNPVAWLDTLLILGTVGSALPVQQRPVFATGAVLASALWFGALVWGARKARAWICAPAAWRILDGLVALSLLGLAASVVAGLV